jgi:hypothetical protein
LPEKSFSPSIPFTMSEWFRMSSVLMNDGANVLEAVAVVADLERSRLWLWRADPGCAKPVASEA